MLAKSRSSNQYGSVESYHVSRHSRVCAASRSILSATYSATAAASCEPRRVPAADRLAEARQRQIREVPRHNERDGRLLARLQFPAPAADCRAADRRAGPSPRRLACSSNKPGGARLRQRGRGGVAFLSAEHRQTHRAEVGSLRQDAAARRVAEFDLVDVDVTPAAGRRVHDLNASRFTGELAHVPIVPFQLFIILSCGGADDFAVDQRD